MALIIPGRFNVIAKEWIKRGVDIGTKGWWEETTLEMIRRNSRTFSHFTDEQLKPYIDQYAPFMVMWNENPDLITLHPADDDRLQFIPQEE